MTEVAGATHASGEHKENAEIGIHNLLHFWVNPVCYQRWDYYCLLEEAGVQVQEVEPLLVGVVPRAALRVASAAGPVAELAGHR
jgi:hypothetical protein